MRSGAEREEEKGRVYVMAENEQENEREFFTLVDDEGTETEFELIGKAEIKGVTYYAMIPAEDSVRAEDASFPDDEICEYVILREDIDEDGEEMLVTIDDDDEFDDVADYFDNLFSEEIDYDGENS